MWNELVQAYESKIAVLEEARKAYQKAVSDVMAEAGPALKQAVLTSPAVAEGAYRSEYLETQITDDVTLSPAPVISARIVDDSGSTGIGISVWVSSCLGGPEATLRVAVALDQVPPGLDLKEWAVKCAGLIPAAAPGEPLEARGLPDVAPDRPIMRIVSVELRNKDGRQVADEVHDAALGLVESGVPLMALVREAGSAMLSAERELLGYRPTLEAKAERVGASITPKQGGLGSWRGGRFLQVGHFWLRAYPPMNQLLVECNSEDETVVTALAESLGLPTARREGCLHFVLLNEAQLRDPDHDVEAAISRAFDYWFDANANRPAAQGLDG